MVTRDDQSLSGLNRDEGSRVLTVKQPWASALVRQFETKNVENRVWQPRVLGRIVIHAGKVIDRQAVVSHGNTSLVSVIVGTVELVSVHRQGSPECVEAGCAYNPWAHWADVGERPVNHWMLAHPRQFRTPIRVARGFQQLWRPSPALEMMIANSDVVGAAR